MFLERFKEVENFTITKLPLGGSKMSNAGQILIIHVKYTTKKIYRAVPPNKKSFVLKLKNKNSIDLPIYW